MQQQSGRNQVAGTLRSRRAGLTGLLFVAVIAVLAVRLLFIQVVDGSTYADDARAETTLPNATPAVRGAIFDASGNPLELAVPRYEVISDNFLDSSPKTQVAQLAPLLHLRASTVAADLAKRSGYVVLAPSADLATKQAVAMLRLPNLSFVETSLVALPAGQLVQPVLGAVNSAGIGYSGIEYRYNRLLAGRAGEEIEQIGANGASSAAAPVVRTRPKPGDGLVLSIDEQLQLVATRALTAEMKAQHADSGDLVIENVHSGAILAMVALCSAESTAPGCFRVAGPKGAIVPAPTNLATTVVFEPGSVMKIATFSFAVQDRLISPASVFSVPDSLQIGGYTFEDAEPHPTIPMPACQILAQSSNIGTIKISRLLGPRRLARALSALGFGHPTGLTWPGASPGLVAPVSTWSGGDLGSIPIGMGEGVTTQQILDAYNTVANGGVFVSPNLVRATVSPNGVVHLLPASPRRRVLTRAADATMVRMFSLVTRDGTAVAGQIPGYSVAGKTGTAQVVNPRGIGYLANDWNATFVGFTPTQSPVLSGIVTLHHPDGYYGGSVSAPVFKNVMTYALHHFEIAAPSTPPPRFPPSSNILANECDPPQLASHSAA